MNTREAKKWLRGWLMRERGRLSSRKRDQLSRVIVGRLGRHPLYRRAKTVATFIGFGSEINTRFLIEKAWSDGKTVVIPAARHGFAQAFFAPYQKGDRLIRTKFGPMEPATHHIRYPLSKIDLMIVPGLGFDDRGGRLGFGGGVYDRYIKKSPQAVHVGLFFSFQKMAQIPRERHDWPLEYILTERGLHSTCKHER